MMSNPFEKIDQRLSNIENLLLDIKHNPKEEIEKIFSVKELATYSGISELSIRNYINDGKIQAERIGRKILIKQSQFEKGLEEVKSLKYKR